MYVLLMLFVLSGNTTVYELQVDKCPDKVDIIEFEERFKTREGVIYLTCHKVRGESI